MQRRLGDRRPPGGYSVEEGFASDAQRRAAFASGYKAKGKKGKKEEVEIDEKSLHPDLHKIVKTKDGYQLMMYSPSDGKFVARGKPQPTERKAEKAALVFASVKVDEEDEDKPSLFAT